MKRHLIQVRAILIAAAVIAALAGVSAFQPLEETGWALRNNLFPSDVSGKVVLVQIDGDTDQTRVKRLAATINALSKLEPERVLLATDTQAVSLLLKDPATRTAMLKLGKKLVVPVSPDSSQPPGSFSQSQARFTPALSADQTAETSPFGMVWHYNYGSRVDDTYIRSAASVIANIPTERTDSFLVDYSYSLDRLPQFNINSASSFSFEEDIIKASHILISYGGTVDALRATLPGKSFSASQNYLHAYAIETVLAGEPVGMGFALPLLIALAFVLGQKLSNLNGRFVAFFWISAVAAGVAIPWLAGLAHYNFEVGPALALVATAITLEMRANWKSRFKMTSRSGAPSFDAFNEQLLPESGSVIVARVSTWTDIQTAIGQTHQTELCRQIIRRLKGADESLFVHHNDAECFCWKLPESGRAISEHLLGLRAIFEPPFSIAGHDIDVNLAFGVADVPTSETVTARLLAQAQSAALEAERLGIVSQTFDCDKVAKYEWHLALHTNIDKAIANGEIWVAYQPKLDLRTNEIVGAEALVRWTHPSKGNISPAEFILHAERSGRIDALTRAVIRDAVYNTAQILVNCANFTMSINLSPALFEKPNLLNWLRVLVEEQSVPPSAITWEVTETREIRDLEAAKTVLDQLRKAGYRISLDDFGTGAANMEVLSHLPFDEIKIDQRFVGRMLNSPTDRAIVEACIRLGCQANLIVVAEGVEDSQTLDLLRQIDCHAAQGYLIGRPGNASDLMSGMGSMTSSQFGIR